MCVCMLHTVAAWMRDGEPWARRTRHTRLQPRLLRVALALPCLLLLWLYLLWLHLLWRLRVAQPLGREVQRDGVLAWQVTSY